MMKTTIARATTLAAILGVTGCSSLFGPEGFFRDRGDDYLKADVIAPMRLPQGVSMQRMEDIYVVPPATQAAFDVTEEFEVPRPQALSENAFTDYVKIQKLGDTSWILVNGAPTEVWPQVRGFLSSHDLDVVFESPSTGIIETAWLKFKENKGTKDKYRLQIEQGVQLDSTEIHVLHISVNSGTPGRGQVNWPARSTSAEREAWMRDELAASIAGSAGSQSASLLAQSIAATEKVELIQDGGEPVLSMRLDYDRAWATVGHALHQEGYTLWDEDRTAGAFYVAYEPVVEEEEPGFLRRWFSFMLPDPKPKEAPKTPYGVAEVLNNLQPEDTELNRKVYGQASNATGKRLSKVPGYLVVMRAAGSSVDVRVRDGYGNTLSEREARKLLSILRHNLI